MKPITFLFVVTIICSIVYSAQIVVPRIEAMPNDPQPYSMRNWKQVASDYDEYIFSFLRAKTAGGFWGDYPAVWEDKLQYNYPWNGFGMPSYIGHKGMTGAAQNGHEAINCLAAVLGASLCGIDKSNQWSQGLNSYKDWVLMEGQYFNKTTGENLVLNYTATDSGNTFWYDIFPGMLYSQLLWKNPGYIQMEADMQTMADRYYQACAAMGGSVSPWAVPNFRHTAFDFDTMSPYDNGHWVEMDSAAGIGWLQYASYLKWGSNNYLTGARWTMEYLNGLTESPLYEVLLPYGVCTAARMNAELGFGYDIKKMFNWCFNPSQTAGSRVGWGVISDSPWGGYDCDGLVGSVTDGGGYAFAMNTFDWVAALAPVARYDQRFANAIGKWVLNAANASRLFYANGLADQNQSCYNWASIYDPQSCVSYEGLRKIARIHDRAVSDYSNAYGLVLSGDYTSTFDTYGDNYQIIEERVIAGGKDALEHIWRIDVRAGINHRLWVQAHGIFSDDGDTGFEFAVSTSPAGPFTNVFTVTAQVPTQYSAALDAGYSGPLYLRAKDNNRIGGNYLYDKLYVEAIAVISETQTTPYAMGDGVSGGRLNWGIETDFALYGASHVGMLGAVVDTTNVERILKLDLLATDFYHSEAFPTYLLYNPYQEKKTVTLNVGSECVDIYETTTHRFVKYGCKGDTDVDLPAGSASVLVFTPSNSQIQTTGTKKLIAGRVIDYRNSDVYVNCEQVSASPMALTADMNKDCSVDIGDLAIFAQDWLSIDLATCNTIDESNDLEALMVMASQWNSSNILAAQIGAFDNLSAELWYDERATGLMTDSSQTGIYIEGNGSLRVQYEQAVGVWDVTPTKVLPEITNLTSKNISLYLWSDLEGDSQLHQIILFDENNKISRVIVDRPQYAGWNRLEISAAEFVPDDSSFDISRVQRLQLWFSSWPDGGTSVYVDDLRFED